MKFGDEIDWNAEALRAAAQEVPGVAPGDMLLNIREALGDVEKPRIADCGCNIARFYPQFRDAGFAYVGVDQSSEALAIARVRYSEASFVHSFLWDDWPSQLPVITRSGSIGRVDAALCNAVLQHNLLGEKERILDRVRQAVRPGGVFAMQESTVLQETRTQLRQENWIKLVERFGFKFEGKKWHKNPEYNIDDAYLFRRTS